MGVKLSKTSEAEKKDWINNQYDYLEVLEEELVNQIDLLSSEEKTSSNQAMLQEENNRLAVCRAKLATMSALENNADLNSILFEKNTQPSDARTILKCFPEGIALPPGLLGVYETLESIKDSGYEVQEGMHLPILSEDKLMCEVLLKVTDVKTRASDRPDFKDKCQNLFHSLLAFPQDVSVEEQKLITKLGENFLDTLNKLCPNNDPPNLDDQALSEQLDAAMRESLQQTFEHIKQVKLPVSSGFKGAINKVCEACGIRALFTKKAEIVDDLKSMMDKLHDTQASAQDTSASHNADKPDVDPVGDPSDDGPSLQ